MGFVSSVQRKSVVLFGMAALLASCQGVLPPAEPPPHRDAIVRVACPPGLGEMVRTQSRAWQSRQQAGVEVVAYNPARGPDSVAHADVWLVPPADLPRWAAAGRLVSLPGSFTERGGSFEWRSLLPAYREQLLAWAGQACAVPVMGEAPVCVYRADLYARRDLQEKYRTFQKGVARAEVRELRPPPTWQEFALQAEFFAAQHPSGKPGPSLPPLPTDEAKLDRLFYTVAAPHARRAISQDQAANEHHLADVFAFHYDLKTGEPRVDTPGFVTALALLRRLQACRPGKSSAEPATALVSGQAVLGVVEASWLVEFQKNPGVRDRFGVCQLPGADRYFTPQGKTPMILKDTSNRVPYLGGAGWLACIPKTSTQVEAALDLLADIAGPARAAQAALEPSRGGPVRSDQLLRDSWSAYDLDRTRSLALREALSRTLLQHGIKNPVLCLRTPDQAAHRAAMAVGLRKALLEGQSAKEALTGVAQKWSALDAKKGKQAHLAEYRISLGLLGK